VDQEDLEVASVAVRSERRCDRVRPPKVPPRDRWQRIRGLHCRVDTQSARAAYQHRSLVSHVRAMASTERISRGGVVGARDPSQGEFLRVGWRPASYATHSGDAHPDHSRTQVATCHNDCRELLQTRFEPCLHPDDRPATVVQVERPRGLAPARLGASSGRFGLSCSVHCVVRALGLSSVLGVGDVVAPRGRPLGDGDVRHEVVVSGTVPVFLTVWCDVDVAGADLDDFLTP